MSNINRDYLIKVDVKTSKVEAPAMHFYNTDVGTSNIYVQLTIKETLINVSPIENATDYRIQASIIKPNNVVKVLNGELVNEEEAIFEFDLPDDCTNISGTYQLEFNINCIVSERTEKITTFPASYEVKKSILTDFVPEITDTEDNTMMEDILTQLEGKFDDVRVNVEETGSTQVSLDFYSNDVKIKNLKFTGGSFIDDTTTAKSRTWSSYKIDSQIKEKANKNEVFTMANMGQDIKEAMTGGSVAVVGRNSILKENIVDGQVTAEKTDFINISSNLFNKNDVITNKYINNTNGTLVNSTTNSVSQLIDIIPSTQLTFKNIQKIACYNESKEFLRIKEFGTESSKTYTLGTDVYFIRTQQPKAVLSEVQINKGSELLTYESYYRNLKKEIGIENIVEKINEKSITSDKRSVLGTFGRLYISPSASDIPNIDTNARTLTLYNNFCVLVNKERYSHNQEVVLTFFDTATIQYLFYNTTTNTFKFIKSTLENEILEDDVYIGMFTFTSNTESGVIIKYAYCDFPLKIDGEIIGDYSTKISNLEKRLKAVENIPKNIPIYTPKTTYACDGSDSNGFTHDVTKANDVYAKYDELVLKYPNYITKTLLGNDSSGTLPIYKYEFKPTQPTILDGYDNTFKKIILINGIHGGGRTTADSGDNPTSVFALYYLMKDICENSGQESLEYLRRNVHFIIIPIANPWGFDNLSRYNVNSVDINRNFDYKWARVEHTGSSAFSEKESQYIRDVVNANKDALFATDLHIQGGGTDPNLDERLLWSSLNTGSKLYYPSNYLISRMSGLWQGKYDLSDIEYYGYLSANNNGMMVRSWCEYVAGIPCNTFEMSSATMNQARNNANIMFMMTQTLGNWILSCLNILS